MEGSGGTRRAGARAAYLRRLRSQCPGRWLARCLARRLPRPRAAHPPATHHSQRRLTAAAAPRCFTMAAETHAVAAASGSGAPIDSAGARHRSAPATACTGHGFSGPQAAPQSTHKSPGRRPSNGSPPACSARMQPSSPDREKLSRRAQAALSPELLVSHAYDRRRGAR